MKYGFSEKRILGEVVTRKGEQVNTPVQAPLFFRLALRPGTGWLRDLATDGRCHGLGPAWLAAGSREVSRLTRKGTWGVRRAG